MNVSTKLSAIAMNRPARMRSVRPVRIIARNAALSAPQTPSVASFSTGAMRAMCSGPPDISKAVSRSIGRHTAMLPSQNGEDVDSANRSGRNSWARFITETRCVGSGSAT